MYKKNTKATKIYIMTKDCTYNKKIRKEDVVHMKRRKVILAIGLMVVLFFGIQNIYLHRSVISNALGEVENAEDVVKNMGVGWNLGNTLDSTNKSKGYYFNTETMWGNPRTTKAMIDEIAKVGYQSIRIPVSWYNHLDDKGVIDEKWLARVGEVVNYALDNELYVIINVHHDAGMDTVGSWIYADTDTYDKDVENFKNVWKQIAEYFKDYDNKLLFEATNEILNKNRNWDWGSAWKDFRVVHELDQEFINVVRETKGNNAQRCLVLSTWGASTDSCQIEQLFYKAFQDTVDNRLILSVHNYTTTVEKIAPLMKSLKTYSDKYKVPIIIDEFGSQASVSLSYRVKSVKEYVTRAKEAGITCFWWDDGASYLIFDRKNLKFKYGEIANAMIEAGKTVQSDAEKQEEEKPTATVKSDTTTSKPIQTANAEEKNQQDKTVSAAANNTTNQNKGQATSKPSCNKEDSSIGENGDGKEVQSSATNSEQANTAETKNKQATPTASKTIEEFDFSNIANWRSGNFNYKDGRYRKRQGRICLVEYLSATKGKDYKVYVPDGYKLLIREISESGRLLRTKKFKNGTSYRCDDDCAMIGISIYNPQNNNVPFTEYQNLLQKGEEFALKECKVKEKIKYIETFSSSKSFYDSSISINEKYKIEMKTAITKNSYGNLIATKHFLFRNEKKKGLYTGYAWWNSRVYSPKVGKTFTIKQDGQKTYINNKKVRNAKSKEIKYQDSYMKIAQVPCKTYYVKVWDDKGTLIRNYIPVLDIDGDACLYDTVAQRYLYYTGTLEYKK